MKKEEIYHWIRAAGMALVIIFLFSLYLYLRRGYYNLYIINKVFGSTAVVIAGITLIIRPLSQKIQSIAQFMTIRRHLGLTALLFALFHFILSFFFLSSKFPLSWYSKEIVPIVFGLGALGVWIYLAYISENEKIRQMGADVWKKHQSLGGKIAFLFVFLHLVILKYPGWIKWFQGQTKQTPELTNPGYPPASLFVLIVMFSVIVYRVLNDYIFSHKK